MTDSDPKAAADKTSSSPNSEVEDSPEPEPAREPRRRPVVVGIGASAGGLEAFQAFFGRMPPDSGMAFVLVSHLDPTHESLLADLLDRNTDMEVTNATDGQVVEANRVYVIPPNAVLSVEEGKLRLTSPRGEWGHRATIDHFFQALAEDYRSSAVCIILSGTGSDGTVGLRAVKEHGGLTMAQTQDSAKHYGMLASAAATGQVDHVLPVEEMPQVLLNYVEHLDDLEVRGGEVKSLEEDKEDRLVRILHLLRSRVGHDFSDYKRSTMARRVQRRMQVLGLLSPDEYLARMRDDDGEAKLLFQDLLIGVTRFFRDREAFETLEDKVLSQLFSGENPVERIRVWVPGCATGEEAYSLAILLCEYMTRLGVERPVQIFATDIDDRSLEVARAGYYPGTLRADLSQERLETYFRVEGTDYRVIKRIREMCIFSRHDLIRDPPFSRLDLVSCRNLLIYFDVELQGRVMPIFHYALRPSGFLFLGPSEGGTVTEDLFVPVASPQRLYRARDTVTRPSLEPLQGVFQSRPRRAMAAGSSPRRTDLRGIAEGVLFAEYGPPFVVINNRDDVIHFSGRTGRYLEPAPGAPTSALLGMSRRGLAMDLRSLIRDARLTAAEVRRDRVRFRSQSGFELVDLVARPLVEAGEDSELVMVIFLPVREQEPSLGQVDFASLTDEDDVVRHLEQELRSAREHLQSTIEELETSNEELKSSNEELLSMNEELQSSNEEMQTSKEELQSTNEELETVNSELNAKLEELARANSDLKNLFDSTRIAIVFLDPEQRIKRFTPAAREIFQLITTDIGRPLSDISSGLAYEHLRRDVKRVMRDGEMVERQVKHASENIWYILRIRPYLTLDGDQDGTVLTLVNVSELKAAKDENVRLNDALSLRVDELETILDLAPVGIAMGVDAKCHEIWVNRAGAEILGLEPGSEASKSSGDVAYRVLRNGAEVDAAELPMQRAATTGRQTEEEEYQIERQDGAGLQILMRATPLLDADGKVRTAVGAFLDISERKHDRDLIELRAEQQEAVAELGVAALSTADLQKVFKLALEVLQEVLGTPLVKLQEYESASGWLRLRAGTGWQDGLIGVSTVPAGTGSQAGYTLDTGQPVVVLDTAEEERFEVAPLLRDHGVVSGVTVVIRGPGSTWGVMGAHTTERREFSRDDVHFVQAVGNVVGAALERQRVAAELANSQKEVALQSAQARLRRAERLASVGTLAAGIAHEITNPVNSILMTAEAALMAAEHSGNGDGDGSGPAGAGPTMGTALERIVGEAERAGIVVRDVLDFSRTEHTRKARQALNPVVESAIERCRRFLQSSPKVTLELGDDLPLVRVAPLEIEQVLINLVRNALEAGGSQVGVRVSTERGPRGSARLSVRDDGPGMDREILPKVFDPFFTTRRRQGGTGLGLSLVHSIVEDHDGDIDVQSTPGEGTLFIIDLPVADAEEPPMPIDEPGTETAPEDAGGPPS